MTNGVATDTEMHMSQRTGQQITAHRKVTAAQADGKFDEITCGMACILHQICAANDKNARLHQKSSPFVGEEIPDIAIFEYCQVRHFIFLLTLCFFVVDDPHIMQRLRKYFNCSPSCVVAALIYIDMVFCPPF